jgi:radical SAM protein (TIGR01212 family)
MSVEFAHPGCLAEAAGRYNSYGSFLKSRFGCRVYKVIVDAGFTCPNRDGAVAYGGCTYCNNDSFRPDTPARRRPVEDQVRSGIEYLQGRYGASKFIVYFQPFSNTYAPLERLAPLYERALAHPAVVGLSVGTRPDCIDDEKLDWFQALARRFMVTLEYGLESIYDDTLKRINRGHDFRCWTEAVRRTRGRGLMIGAHVILGFPWESRQQMLAMAPAISSCGIAFLKLHHLHVVRNTVMAREYERNAFPTLDYSSYLELVVDFLERLDPGIAIERLFGLAPEADLIAPRWGKTKAEIQRDIELRLLHRDSRQGKFYQPAGAAGARSY